MAEFKRQKVLKAGSVARSGWDDEHSEWKALVPLLYDWFAHHHLVWPSLSCRWGTVLEDRKHKYTQKLFLSEQTDGSAPNTLVVAHVEVVKQRVAAAKDISRFDYKKRSPFVRKVKTIIHPGEVNKIRELAQKDSIVLTHSDIPEVLLWDTDRQPSIVEDKEPVPDLVLAGHTENAEFALATCRSAPLVISGGQDKNVLLWSVQDHIAGSLQALGEAVQAAPDRTGGAAEGGGEGDEIKESKGEGHIERGSQDGETKERSGEAEGGPSSSSAPKEGAGEGVKPVLGQRARANQVLPRGIFQGHTATVEDVQFHPTDEHLFCSVADDCQLLFWDSRAPGDGTIAANSSTTPTSTAANTSGNGGGSSGGIPESSGGVQGPVMRVERAHDSDVHSVDWNPVNTNLVVTGSADRTARVFDIRKIGDKEKDGKETGGGGDPGSSPATGPGAKPPKSKAVFTFKGAHTEPITCVQWCPDLSTSFATSAEDGLVNIWDARLISKRGAQPKAEGGLPGLLFRHIGHRGQVSEFQWSPVDPWTLASVATNSTQGAGHSLQLWRVLDLIYRPARESLLELEKYL